MSPEKGLSQKGNESSSHLPTIDFQGGDLLVFRGVIDSWAFFSPMNLEVPTYEASKVGIHGMSFRCSHWIHRPSTLPNEGREIHWFAPWTFYRSNLFEANSCHICIFVWQVFVVYFSWIVCWAHNGSYIYIYFFFFSWGVGRGRWWEGAAMFLFPNPIWFVVFGAFGNLGYVMSMCSIETGWWFQTFFIFTPIWGRLPFWLIFFKGVETTNQ